jgi:hypothetical protein
MLFFFEKLGQNIGQYQTKLRIKKSIRWWVNVPTNQAEVGEWWLMITMSLGIKKVLLNYDK